MKHKIKSYKEKLGKAIAEYMEMPVSERSSMAVKSMVECWEELDDLEKKMCNEREFTMEDAQDWASRLVNDDGVYPKTGSKGPHWPIETTTSVAMSEGITWDHITPYCWWIAMNSMYSDYCKVADRFGVGTPEFFAAMAKAFLFDKDAKSPKHKMSAYYHNIVVHE